MKVVRRQRNAIQQELVEKNTSAYKRRTKCCAEAMRADPTAAEAPSHCLDQCQISRQRHTNAFKWPSFKWFHCDDFIPDTRASHSLLFLFLASRWWLFHGTLGVNRHAVVIACCSISM